jgi:NADH dehydrogenase
MITVFGGSGFLGMRLVQRLAANGLGARVAVRHPAEARAVLKKAGVDNVEVIFADVRDDVSVAAAVAGAAAIVNAVSAYVEAGNVTFSAIHEVGAERVAKAVARGGIARLVLVSGIGADADAPSPYIRSRGRGENLVRAAFPPATIVRPSVMFGPGDALFGAIAALAARLPALPLIGGGRTRLQPVDVRDVAEAVARIVVDPGTAGRTYELAGPRIYTFRELVELALRASGRRRILLTLPFPTADLMARLFELSPWPLLTTGQVDLLRKDNVASGSFPGLADLGITPTEPEEIVPTYIGRSTAPRPG